MRFFPRSLLWRNFVLIAALILLAVAAWFQLFRFSEREPRARQTADLVASVVNLTRVALVTAQPDLRRELLLELQEQEGIRVYPADPGERIVPLATDRTGTRIFAAEVRRQLGPDTRLATERDGLPGFWVSFRIDSDEYWVMLPRERVERAVALRWLGWGAFVLVAALAGAWLIVFRLRRPLRALVGAAADIGRGRVPARLDESGPEEIRTVSHAFNQMTRDLARLDQDRALILAGVSHDLRTPLTRMRMEIEMLDTDEESRKTMVADVEEMDRTIGQFLVFARGAEGEATEATDLSALLGELAEGLRRRGIQVNTELAELPPLALPAEGLRRSVSNLLENAVRHGDGGVLDLALRAAPGAIQVEVADRGPGIPAQEAERLKLPFTRLDTARSNTGGSGLGLAIVDRWVRGRGGRFELLPREGGGLLARITIPAP